MEVAKRGTMEKSMMIWNLLMKNHEDVLVEIFKRLDIFESPSAVSRFCEAWGRASSNQSFWQTLDFSMLKSDFIKITAPPYVWVNSNFDNTLYNLLFIALNLSQGNIKTLIFHYYLYLTNDQFMYTAKRYVLI